MADSDRRRKRARVDDEDDGDDHIGKVAEIGVDLDDSDEDFGEEEDMIQVDFDFAVPREEDYFAIKRALAHYLSKSAFAAGELADAIVAQSHVGTVVKANDQPIGFVSVLNMHTDSLPMTQIKEYALSKVSGSDRATLRRLFDDAASPLGLLVNYRVANAPPQIAPFLHRALHKEIGQAASTDPAFRFENLLLLTRTYTERDAESTGDVASDGPRAKRQKGDSTTRHSFFFEEELYAEAATVVASFGVNDDAAAGKLTFESVIDVQGQLLVVPTAAVETILERLEPYLDESLLSRVEDW